MPHTSRNKKPMQPKRAQVADEDGWTHVIKGSRSYNRKPPSANLRREPPAIPAGFTLEKVQQQYESYRDEWEASPCHNRLEAMLDTGIRGVERPEICNAVCLGLGSMFDPEHKKHSFFQFAAFRTILRALGTYASYLFSLSITKAYVLRYRSRFKHIPGLRPRPILQRTRQATTCISEHESPRRSRGVFSYRSNNICVRASL